jgi:hypothetical protein
MPLTANKPSSAAVVERKNCLFVARTRASLTNDLRCATLVRDVHRTGEQYGGTRGFDGGSMERDCTPASRERSAWRPMARPSHDHQRHLVEAAHGRALAGPTRTLWPVADLCGSALYRWRRDGTWDRMLAHVQTRSARLCTVFVSNRPHELTARASTAAIKPHWGPNGRWENENYPTDACRRTNARLSLKVAADCCYQRARWRGGCPAGARAEPQRATRR